MLPLGFHALLVTETAAIVLHGLPVANPTGLLLLPLSFPDFKEYLTHVIAPSLKECLLFFLGTPHTVLVLPFLPPLNLLHGFFLSAGAYTDQLFMQHPFLPTSLWIKLQCYSGQQNDQLKILPFWTHLELEVNVSYCYRKGTWPLAGLPRFLDFVQ